MITVKATREGLIGGKTASGYVVDTVVPFVALPSVKAMKERRLVKVRNPKTGLSVRAFVLDVGPWNEHDDAYVFQPATTQPHRDGVSYQVVRPAAESGLDTRGRKTNGAGIDLGEAVWHALGMTDNDTVLWEFE